MDARKEGEPTPMNNRTTVERKSERELVVTRSFDAPARIVFEAWTKPELFKRWWAPKSTGMSLLSCEMDVRVGGGYRLEFGHAASEQPMTFFGRYIEVTPNAHLVWTNEEGSSRRCYRGYGRWDARAVRATGRASRHPGAMTSHTASCRGGQLKAHILFQLHAMTARGELY